MRLKTLLCALPLVCAAAAHAEDFTLPVPLVANLNTPGAYSAGWGVTHLFAGAFTDTFNFAPITAAGMVSASLVTIGFNDYDNIDFSSVTINGQAFVLSPTGQIEIGQFAPAAIGAPLVMVVSGVVAPALAAGTVVSASYAGTVNVSPVPELQTSALLAAGLIAIGFIAQRRRTD